MKRWGDDLGIRRTENKLCTLLPSPPYRSLSVPRIKVSDAARFDANRCVKRGKSRRTSVNNFPLRQARYGHASASEPTSRNEVVANRLDRIEGEATNGMNEGRPTGIDRPSLDLLRA